MRNIKTGFKTEYITILCSRQHSSRLHKVFAEICARKNQMHVLHSILINVSVDLRDHFKFVEVRMQTKSIRGQFLN